MTVNKTQESSMARQTTLHYSGAFWNLSLAHRNNCVLPVLLFLHLQKQVKLYLESLQD
jgi:hypothetical protein